MRSITSDVLAWPDTESVRSSVLDALTLLEGEHIHLLDETVQRIRFKHRELGNSGLHEVLRPPHLCLQMFKMIGTV